MPTFSHSSIEMFRRYLRQYYYWYIARVKMPEVPEQIATFSGSRCHDALEWLYGWEMEGVVPTRKQVLAEFNSVWNDNWLDDIIIREDGMTPKRYRSLGEKRVGDYYDAHHPFDDATTIGLRKQVSSPLDADAGITMLGYIDSQAKDAGGTWHVHDSKTNKGLPTQADKDADPHLAYYEIGLKQMWPDSVKRFEIHWHFLLFGETITSTRRPEQLESHRHDAQATIGDALGRSKNEDAYEPIETPLCNYCDYQSIFPVKKHEAAVRHDDKAMFHRMGFEPDDYAELEQRLIESLFWDRVSCTDAGRLWTLWEQPETLNLMLHKLLGQFVRGSRDIRTGLRPRRPR